MHPYISILFQLRPKISFVISTFYQLAFVGAEDEGRQVSKLDLEAGVASAEDGDDGEAGNSEKESGGDGVWNRVHRVDRSPGLSFGWDKSVANEKLLSNLKIDRNNIVSIVNLICICTGQKDGFWLIWYFTTER